MYGLGFGWSEAYPGGMLTNRHPEFGGIIDQNIPTKTWFVIFNSETYSNNDVEGLKTREEAIQFFIETVKP